MSIVLFNKAYNADDFCDMDKDIVKAFDPRFSPVVLTIPTDKNEMFKGTIKFTIEWFSDSDKGE